MKKKRMTKKKQLKTKLLTMIKPKTLMKMIIKKQIKMNLNKYQKLILIEQN
jgi:hypothetical protein